MSAFLGPIHYWLYNKIQLQEEMLRRIVLSAEELHWQELSPELKEASLSAEVRPLEELIDTANIHGWLQERIHDAEGRYARLVTELLKPDTTRMGAMKTALHVLGEEHSVEENADAKDAFRLFEDSLLNGMPCDRVNVVTSQDVESCSWEQTTDIHKDYWENAGGDVENYYLLRKAFMEGMLSGSKLELVSPDNVHYTVALRGASDGGDSL